MVTKQSCNKFGDSQNCNNVQQSTMILKQYNLITNSRISHDLRPSLSPLFSSIGNKELHQRCAGWVWISVTCDMAFLNWLLNNPSWLITEVSAHFFSSQI